MLRQQAGGTGVSNLQRIGAWSLGPTLSLKLLLLGSMPQSTPRSKAATPLLFPPKAIPTTLSGAINTVCCEETPGQESVDVGFVFQLYLWLTWVESLPLSGILGKSGTFPICKMKGGGGHPQGLLLVLQHEEDESSSHTDGLVTT